MNTLSPREWILILVCAVLLLAVFALLIAVVIGLLIERIYIGRRLERALHSLGLLQMDLFNALGNAYRSVEHSHKMVMRVMRVVDGTLGIQPEKDEDEEEWPKIVGEKSEGADGGI